MAPVPTCYFRGRRGEKLLCGETLGNQESHIQEVSADQHRIEEKCNTTVRETTAESYWYTAWSRYVDFDPKTTEYAGLIKENERSLAIFPTYPKSHEVKRIREKTIVQEENERTGEKIGKTAYRLVPVKI